MPSTCPDCGEDTWISEDCSGQTQKVCTSCGYVSGESIFEEDLDKPANAGNGFIESSLPKDFIKYNVKQLNDDKPVTHGEIEGTKRVTELCHVLHLNQHALDSAKSVFSKAYRQLSRGCTARIRNVICAASVLIACRQSGFYQTFHQIANVAQCSHYEIGEKFHLIKKNVDVEVPTLSTLNYAWTFCSQLGLEEHVIHMVEDLIKMFEAVIPVEGKHHESILKSSAFICWKASNYHMNKDKKFSQFCTAMKIKKNHNNRPIQKYIEVLQKVAGEVPWISESDVKGNNIFYHVKDILNYRKTIGSNNELKRALHDDFVFSPKRVKKDELQATAINYDGDMDSVELSNKDIPDSELHHFIRSEPEVENIKSLRDKALKLEID